MAGWWRDSSVLLVFSNQLHVGRDRRDLCRFSGGLGKYKSCVEQTLVSRLSWLSKVMLVHMQVCMDIMALLNAPQIPSLSDRNLAIPGDPGGEIAFPGQLYMVQISHELFVYLLPIESGPKQYCDQSQTWTESDFDFSLHFISRLSNFVSVRRQLFRHISDAAAHHHGRRKWNGIEMRQLLPR